MKKKTNFLTTDKKILEEEKRQLVNVFLDFLSSCEFELYIVYKNGESCFKLRDITECNFGDIEDDCYGNLNNILGRLEMYANDTIYRDIEEQSDESGIYPYYLNEAEMIYKILYESVKIGEILESITPDVYVMNNYHKFDSCDDEKLLIRYLVSETIDKLFDNGLIDVSPLETKVEQALNIFQFKNFVKKIFYNTETCDIKVDIHEYQSDYNCQLILERGVVECESLKQWFYEFIIELIKKSKG